ncbi:MAG TPA: FkbM family methyltransferase [Candidatus Limnocylindria bacterium]|jgi:FkbM family methyltransferase|nr:FkbM family methyltransferase [Candidatus Limnocylindria bacterium]
MKTALFDLSPRVAYHGVMRRLVPGLYRPPEPLWVTVASGPLKGGSLLLAIQATDTWQNMANGTADGFLFDALIASRKLEGACIWDIGGHFGYHSLCFASLVGPTGRVIMFEPNPANIVRFKLHAEKNPALAQRIRLEPAAVADRAGEATFMMSDMIESGGSSGSHLSGVDTPVGAGHYQLFSPHQVKLVSVDDLVFKGGFLVPDVMKIDVEGAEGLVLDGALETLRRHRPFLLMEIHHILQMKKVYEVLPALGYRIQLLDEKNATPSRCFISASRS